MSNVSGHVDPCVLGDVEDCGFRKHLPGLFLKMFQDAVFDNISVIRDIMRFTKENPMSMNLLQTEVLKYIPKRNEMTVNVEIEWDELNHKHDFPNMFDADAKLRDFQEE